jgi:hypothetical protein
LKNDELEKYDSNLKNMMVGTNVLKKTIPQYFLFLGCYGIPETIIFIFIEFVVAAKRKQNASTREAS